MVFFHLSFVECWEACVKEKRRIVPACEFSVYIYWTWVLLNVHCNTITYSFFALLHLEDLPLCWCSSPPERNTVWILSWQGLFCCFTPEAWWVTHSPPALYLRCQSGKERVYRLSLVVLNQTLLLTSSWSSLGLSLSLLWMLSHSSSLWLLHQLFPWTVHSDKTFLE